ncbi:MAG: AAA family ATPase [Acidobacteriaceae bacterium]
MILTFDQIRRYFEHRHPGQKIGTRNKASVRCAFHDDSTASCTLFLDGAGGFHCNGCGAGGNVFQFEARFSNCSVQEAEKTVAEITGARPDASFAGASKLGPVVAAYDYRDSSDRVLFQKRRYEPVGESKTFRVYRPDKQGGWLAGIDAPEGTPTKRVLYNLPAVVVANCVAICEGEKDADNVAQAGLYADRLNIRLATTCNFDGAWQAGEKEKWLPGYSPYLAGKFVLVFQDNDAPGEAWATGVATAVHPFADSVKIIRLSGLEPKGDVSDWLEMHTVAELEDEIRKTPRWRPAVAEQRSMFQDAVEFAADAPARVDWLVENVIPAAGNGIICGDPKASKSFHALDLAMSLACGCNWLGMHVSKRVKTALVSREDSPGLTQRRINRLLCGNSQYGLQLSPWMMVNTRRHQADFKVTTEAHLDQLISELKRFRVEFCVLDVFRSLHDSEENDNTEIPLVLQKINRIQTECDCAVALVHHINKVSSDNIFKGLRGASAIHGWLEWGIGISVTNPEEEDKAKYVRKLEFENKEGVAPAVYSQICEGDSATIRIKRVERPEETQRKTRRVADVFAIGAPR